MTELTKEERKQLLSALKFLRLLAPKTQDSKRLIKLIEGEMDSDKSISLMKELTQMIVDKNHKQIQALCEKK